MKILSDGKIIKLIIYALLAVIVFEHFLFIIFAAIIIEI